MRLVDKRDLRLRNPAKAIQYVGFGGKGDKLGQADTRGAYLAARYESRREITDFSLEDYLKGHTDLNPADEQIHAYQRARDKVLFDKTVKLMRLGDLLSLPVNTLSNGQTRRARIAKALMERPRLVLLDEPFLGIDPLSQRIMSPLLFLMSRRSGPQIILALQPQDEVPRWITHVVYLGPGCTVKHMGSKEDVVEAAVQCGDPINLGNQVRSKWRKHRLESQEELKEDALAIKQDSGDTGSPGNSTSRPAMPRNMNRWDMNYDVSGPPVDVSEEEPLIEMRGIKVSYGDRTVLGNWQQDVGGHPEDGLWWNINRGERWGIFGPNGMLHSTTIILAHSVQVRAKPLSFRSFVPITLSRTPCPSATGDVLVSPRRTRLGCRYSTFKLVSANLLQRFTLSSRVI